MQRPPLVDRRLVTWFIAGMVTAALLQLLQAQALGGGFDALLSVGGESPMRPVIESELGSVTTVPGPGHDGQTVYIVARDPWALGTGHETVDHAGFRYRRILYPALAGVVGVLPAKATLIGLTLVAIIGFGMAAAATADIARSYRLDDRLAIAALVCPGLWLSVQLLTVDALAVGLALAGLAWWLRGARLVAALVLATAVLTKDQMLLMPLAISAYELLHRRVRPAITAIVPSILALAAWGLYVSAAVGEGFTTRGNLTLPFKGILDSGSVWSSTATSDLALSFIMLSVVVVGGMAVWGIRRTLLGWVLGAWLLLAVITSNWVWDLGNNSARVFAIVVPLAAIGVALLLDTRGAPRTMAESA